MGRGGDRLIAVFLFMTLETLCKHTEHFLYKANSRKFLAWITATIGLFTQFVNEDNWLMITMLWMGAQAFLDYRNKGLTQNENNDQA